MASTPGRSAGSSPARVARVKAQASPRPVKKNALGPDDLEELREKIGQLEKSKKDEEKEKKLQEKQKKQDMMKAKKKITKEIQSATKDVRRFEKEASKLQSQLKKLHTQELDAEAKRTKAAEKFDDSINRTEKKARTLQEDALKKIENSSLAETKSRYLSNVSRRFESSRSNLEISMGSASNGASQPQLEDQEDSSPEASMAQLGVTAQREEVAEEVSLLRDEVERLQDQNEAFRAKLEMSQKTIEAQTQRIEAMSQKMEDQQLMLQESEAELRRTELCQPTQDRAQSESPKIQSAAPGTPGDTAARVDGYSLPSRAPDLVESNTLGDGRYGVLSHHSSPRPRVVFGGAPYAEAPLSLSSSRGGLGQSPWGAYTAAYPRDALGLSPYFSQGQLGGTVGRSASYGQPYAAASTLSQQYTTQFGAMSSGQQLRSRGLVAATASNPQIGVVRASSNPRVMSPGTGSALVRTASPAMRVLAQDWFSHSASASGIQAAYPQVDASHLAGPMSPPVSYGAPMSSAGADVFPSGPSTANGLREARERTAPNTTSSGTAMQPRGRTCEAGTDAPRGSLLETAPISGPTSVSAGTDAPRGSLMLTAPISPPAPAQGRGASHFAAAVHKVTAQALREYRAAGQDTGDGGALA